MKKIKTLLRSWMAASVIAGFLFGWIAFAHSSKPAAISSAQTLTSSSSASSSTGAQGLITLQQSQTSVQPRLRTGGS